MNEHTELLASLKGRVIVSCQPVVGGPLDTTEFVVGQAAAAVDGGAVGLRIESVASVSGVRKQTDLPIIGLTKRDLADSPVRITPNLEDAEGLIAAGADIVAYDATQRERPVPTAEIVALIRSAGVIAMADCASIEDGRQALAEGAQVLGTTLSGYAYKETDENSPPDFAFIEELTTLDAFVIAEGRIRTPAEAAKAIRHGADSVVVGSAITRIEHITDWFATAIAAAATEGRGR